MGLNWLQLIKKRLAKSEQIENSANLPYALQRILFIGYGKIYGFDNFQWEDWNWKNAADFEVVFINMGTLLKLLSDWTKELSSDPDNFSHERYERLKGNLVYLKGQVLQVINSDRAIFVLATPQFTLYTSKRSAILGDSISVYDWCPLPVRTIQEKGEASKDVDARFSEYRRQMKQWLFYFEDKPYEIRSLDEDDLSGYQSYVALVKSMFVNLSLRPLGIELRYGIFDRNIPDNENPISVSGPIYLLHFPVSGNVRKVLNDLVRQFCNVNLDVSEEPEWINSVLPPRGNDIDMQVHQISAEINNLTEIKSQLVSERQQLELWRKLLYETGYVLEDVVLDALRLLGLIDAKRGTKGEYDIIGDFEGETILFEVKGLSKSAGKGEVFSLNRHIEEFAVRYPDRKIAKGVLISNSYRNLAPDLRGNNDQPIFASDALKHAELLSFALVDTRDLYTAVTDVIEGNNKEMGKLLREVRQIIGVYSYKLD